MLPIVTTIVVVSIILLEPAQAKIQICLLKIDHHYTLMLCLLKEKGCCNIGNSNALWLLAFWQVNSWA